MNPRALWMFGIALVFAALAAYAAFDWLEGQVPEPVAVADQQDLSLSTVVVAMTPLVFGDTIRPEHLTVVDWPANVLPTGSFRTIEEVLSDTEDRIALRPIEVNEPILTTKISGFGVRASLSAIINEEMRATTVRVNDVIGVGGFVVPGDHVDVVLTIGAEPSEMRSLIVLQNIKVLGIDQDANENRSAPTVVRAVTLEASTLDVQKLALAAQLGTLSLALRSMTDVENYKTTTVRARDITSATGTSPRQGGGTSFQAASLRTSSGYANVKVYRGIVARTYRVPREPRQNVIEPVIRPLNLTPRADLDSQDSAVSAADLDQG